MYFKKTLTLSGSNYWTYAKSMIFQLFLLAFVVALFGLFFFDFGTNVIKAIKDEKILSQAQNLLSDLINWDEESEINFLSQIDDFINSIRYIASSIPNFTQTLILAICFFFLSLYFAYFFSGLILYTNTYLINQFMATNNSGYYMWTFFKNISKNVKITLLSSLFCMILDCGIFMTFVGAYVVCFSSIGVWGIVISMLLFMFLICLRKTLIAYCLPAYINDAEGIKHSMKENILLLFEDFWKLFLKTLIFVVIGVVLTVLTLVLFKVVVAAVVMILIICFFSYLLSCAYLVNYYETKNKSYFTKRVKISIGDDISEEEKLNN